MATITFGQLLIMVGIFGFGYVLGIMRDELKQDKDNVLNDKN